MLSKHDFDFIAFDFPHVKIILAGYATRRKEVAKEMLHTCNEEEEYIEELKEIAAELIYTFYIYYKHRSMASYTGVIVNRMRLSSLKTAFQVIKSKDIVGELKQEQYTRRRSSSISSTTSHSSESTRSEKRLRNMEETQKNILHQLQNMQTTLNLLASAARTD